jgi:hypothetical protein
MKARKDNKVLRLQYKKTTSRFFLDYMRPRIRKFIIHNFIVCFQVEQYKICLDTFLKTSMMLVIDFAKNYTFKEYNEVQKMHWHSFQLTILVHICYSLLIHIQTKKN